MSRISALCAASAIAASAPARGDTVLVAGTHTGGDTITAHLVNAGHTVVRVASDSLPADLSPYGVVWMHTLAVLSVQNLAKLEAVVELGRGVYLNGEISACCPTSQNGEALVNATVLGAGSITVGDPGFIASGLGTANPTAIDGITQNPYAPPQMQLFGTDRILGAAAANQVVTGSGSVFAGAWGDSNMVGGKGRIVVVMDSNWVENGDPWVDEWVANFQVFLQGAPAVPALSAPWQVLLAAAMALVVVQRLAGGRFPKRG